MRTEPSREDLNRSRVITDQVIKEVTQHILANKPAATMEELVIEQANAVTQEVFHQFRSMYNLGVIPMRYDDAVQHILKLYRDKYRSWDKDQVLMLLCLIQAVLGAESFRDELI